MHRKGNYRSFKHFVHLDGIIPVGSVGLAVTQSSMLTAMLQHGARMLVEFIAQLTSVERILEYTRIETEQNLFEGRKDLMTSMWRDQSFLVLLFWISYIHKNAISIIFLMQHLSSRGFHIVILMI